MFQVFTYYQNCLTFDLKVEMRYVYVKLFFIQFMSVDNSFL